MRKMHYWILKNVTLIVLCVFSFSCRAENIDDFFIAEDQASTVDREVEDLPEPVKTFLVSALRTSYRNINISDISNFGEKLTQLEFLDEDPLVMHYFTLSSEGIYISLLKVPKVPIETASGPYASEIHPRDVWEHLIVSMNLETGLVCHFRREIIDIPIDSYVYLTRFSLDQSLLGENVFCH